MWFDRKLYEKHLSQQRKQKNIAEARKLLDDLRERFAHIDNPLPPILGILRGCDPFVFEELLLHIFEDNQEFNVVRNKRYTGDGGIDGRFYFDDYPFLVQAKRYKSHINPKHVEEFAEKITVFKAEFGLFIHTGKTGKLSSKTAWHSRKDLMLVSGQKLVNLVLQGNAEELLSDHLENTI